MSEPDTKKVLIDTLEYVKQLVEIRKEPAYHLSDYNNIRVFEAELQDKPGIVFCPESLDDSPVWLEVKRLQPNPAPKLTSAIIDWVDLTNDVSKEPKLKEWILLTVADSEAAEYIKTGIAREENVLKSPRKEGFCDVRFFSADNPSVLRSFKTYVEKKWIPWSIAEKPVRQSIAIYQKLFGIHQKMNAGEAERPLELVWGLGHALWDVKDSAKVISHPLVELLVELDLDKSTQSIYVRPRSILQDKPRINVEAYEDLEIAASKTVKDFFDEQLEELEKSERALTPEDSSTYDLILRSAVASLSEDARYWPDVVKDKSDRAIPKADDKLTVTDTWVIFARNKSQNSLSQDIERLQKKAAKVTDTKGSVAFRFSEEPSNERPKRSSAWGSSSGGGSFSGGGSSSNWGEDEDEVADSTIFFPKPYNDAQREIIKRLDRSDGVVVQGPPGTGKTHTIANIICHYLATGRRVLVTAKSETALHVLKEQIPTEIQPLVISLVSNDQEGLRQQKEAIKTLQAKVVTLQGSERQIFNQIKSGEAQVESIGRELALIESKVAEIAKKQLDQIDVPFEGLGFKNAKDLAVWIVEYREAFQWFPDAIGIEPKFEPQFGDQDIARLIEAKEAVGDEIKLNGVAIPNVNNLPSTETIARIHKDLLNYERLHQDLDDDNLPKIKDADLDQIEALEGVLKSADSVIDWFKRPKEAWNYDVLLNDVESNRRVPTWLEVILEIFPDIEAAMEEKKVFLRHPVNFGTDLPEELAAVQEATSRALQGKSPLSLIQKLNKKSKSLLSQIKVVGLEFESKEYWQHIERVFVFRKTCQELAARWNATAELSSLEPIRDNDPLPTLEAHFNSYEEAKHCAILITNTFADIRRVFGTRIRTLELRPELSAFERIKEVAEQNLSIFRLDASKRARLRAIEELGKFELAEAVEARDFLISKVGQPSEDVGLLETEWIRILDRFSYLNNLSNHFDTINEVCAKISRSGADKWAKTLSSLPLSDLERSQFSTWKDAWRWQRLNTLFWGRNNQDELVKLEAERHQIEKQLNKTFKGVIRQKTFLELCTSMSPRAKAGLAKFTAAIANIPKGRGKKAPFFIKAAQKAMAECADAVPCWIMPSWRVSEVLPSELDYFDLVIVDEASQCDIRELPAIARGQKLLIVGDDQQVSPTAEFVDFNKFLQLKHNYLSEQPFGEMMVPGYSLYDLASAVFSGSRIILNEHFRCVEPIIRFSFQFYQGGNGEDLIQPLRIPKASERIDPPLVDIYVKDGCRAGETNPREAEVIVEEISRLVEDPIFDGRTIGVISMIGRKQAERIQKLLLDSIGQETYMRHEIVCGDSATFQGREKDIIFLSMVAAKGTKKVTKSTSRMYEQRFNVAASRARDRMYLVHSVRLDELSSDDLKAKLLRHFEEPMPAKFDVDKELIELCDSPFEEEVFTKLVDAGYLVRPQVPSMGRSIDLVVEGVSDARLAIELDGDSYHGPEVWLEDWMRQKTLERVGWKFWRCWYSSYVADPEACMQSLFQRLEAEKIYPQEESAVIHQYTEFRKVSLHKEEPITLTEEIPKDELVEVGDLVVLSPEDTSSGYVSIQLVEENGNPDNMIFDQAHPMSRSLIGRAIEDEVELELQGKYQRVCIVSLEKATSSIEEDNIDELSATEPVQVSSSGRIVRSATSDMPEIDDEDNESASISKVDANLSDTESEVVIEASEASSTLAATESFPDPRTATRHEIIESLVSVVRALGPMYSIHAYHEYLARVGIKKLGRAIEERLNSALEVAIVSGQLQKIPGHGITKSSEMLIKLNDQPDYLIRPNLSRSLDEIPKNELSAVSKQIKESQAYLDGDEHIRAILSFYGMKRLTEHTRQVLKEAITMDESQKGEIQEI
jgi:transcription elongation GreA/GreB family factor/very-short-patch-repair endonuclease